MKTVDVVASIVAEEGITHAFGLMGDGNLNLITFLTKSLGVAFHSSRHEAAAVGMADGYARVADTVSFCTVTQGPGLTNALTALVTARKAHTPLVIFVGDIPSAQSGWPQDVDHHRILDSIDVPVVNLTNAVTVHDDVRTAFARARAEHRPIALNMPVDRQKVEWEPWDTDIDRAEQEVASPPEPSPHDVDALCELVQAGKRPVIIAGRGARNARAALIELGDAIGALLATTLPAKGLFAGELYDVGIAGSLATNLGASLIGQADLVLAFGASLNDFTTMKRTFFSKTAKIVRIDLEATGDRPNRLPVNLEVIADSGSTASALLARLDPGGTGFRTDTTVEAIRGFSIDREFVDRSDDEGIDPRSLMRTLDRLLPTSRTVVTDVGHFFGFPATYLGSSPADRFVSTIEFGAVGTGIGAAIGASIAEPDRPTVAFIGDGGLMMSLGDLETAARESRNLLIVVLNDSAYGSELHMLREWKLDTSASVFPPISFESVAGGLGIRSASARSLADVERVLSRPLDLESGLLLLDCRITTGVVAEWLAGAFDH